MVRQGSKESAERKISKQVESSGRYRAGRRSPTSKKEKVRYVFFFRSRGRKAQIGERNSEGRELERERETRKGAGKRIGDECRRKARRWRARKEEGHRVVVSSRENEK